MEYYSTADELDPENLGEEDDTRGNLGDGDQVLVDQHQVGPDAGDARLPGREGDGRPTPPRLPSPNCRGTGQMATGDLYFFTSLL